MHVEQHSFVALNEIFSFIYKLCSKHKHSMFVQICVLTISLGVVAQRPGWLQMFKKHTPPVNLHSGGNQ